ncbi:uncharacterized protein LOC133914629 [Phragmites australis]|uniref:uncharacterized protein LOC133914629 n=1 Tax=Phragmites australis TaxID=29695 RepID=UPI002D7730E6|nr:uncharacterized protein LOC133914629 [Phragmites australis]
MALEAIPWAVPPEMISTLATKPSTTEAWESLKAMHISTNRVRKAKSQQLRKEYEVIQFHDGEAVEDFALHLSGLVNQMATVGEVIDNTAVVEKYLRMVPPRFAQITLYIETSLDLSTLSIENVTSWLKAAEDCCMTNCQNCGKLGHWTKDYRQLKRDEQAHLVQGDDDESILLMEQACALTDSMELTYPGCVELDEMRAQVNLGCEGKSQSDVWYLDTRASNHMTGDDDTFAELDTGTIDSVKFGDGSIVDIRGRTTVLFKCKNSDHRAVTDVYFIPKLKSNIISIG